MRRALEIFREPLVLFSATAAVVFGVHALVVDGGETKTLNLTPEAIAGSIAIKSELWGRALTPEERAEVVDTLVRQEILVQEASARGLHLHDSKTRKRLVTQMHFVMTEDAPTPRPEDLAALYEAQPEEYMFPKTVSFDHVFFETDKSAAQQLMDDINTGKQIPAEAGDRFWLGDRLEYYAPAQIAIVLGASFGASLSKLEPGQWTGPIRSGRGWHLVRLDTFHPPAKLPPEELDRKLREDWANAYRKQSFETRYEELKADYTIKSPSQETIEAATLRLRAAQADLIAKVEQ